MTDSFQLNHDPLTFVTGQKFGKRYKIIEKIGHGGMGKVFKAYDKELDIVVALKMIKPSLTANEDVITRFKRELLLAREIQHDNVIRIHDLGEIDEIKYISMNYINGNSLNEIVESVGPLSIDKSVDLAKQIGCALSAAHAKGIVHRDLKPQNIMIDKQGKVYVLDFGIARSLRQSSHTTEPGVIIGTPDIMSPEQIKGEKADERSDIYALGVIMFQMVAGELPFIAEDYNSLLYKHVNEPVPTTRQINPLIPDPLSKIIEKCMAKDPQDRFQSIDEFNRKLDHVNVSQANIPGKKRKKSTESCESSRATSNSKKITYKALKFSYRFVFVLLILYGLISVSSLVTDAYYDVQVDQIKAEYNTYYKNLFPIKKDWVKETSALKEANAWTIFAKTFPLKTKITSTATQMSQQESNRYIQQILNHAKTASMKQLFNLQKDLDLAAIKVIMQTYGSLFRFEDLFQSRSFSLLNPLPLSNNSQSLNLDMVKIYTQMICVMSRGDIGAGKWREVLARLNNYLYFCLDLYKSSVQITTAKAALANFHDTLQEIIPTITLARQKLSAAKLLQTISKSPWLSRRPDLVIVEAFDSDINLNVPVVTEIESILIKIIANLDLDKLLYRDFLHLVHTYSHMDEIFGYNKTSYYYVKKMEFWKYFFSRNKYFYKTGFIPYKKLLTGLQYIRNLHDKSIYISDFARENKLRNNRILSRIPHLSASLLIVQTQAKLILTAINIMKFGKDSPQFLEFSKGEFFSNDITGKKFKILTGKKSLIIFVHENLQLQIPTTNFPGDYIKSLSDSRQFIRQILANPIFSRSKRNSIQQNRG